MGSAVSFVPSRALDRCSVERMARNELRGSKDTSRGDAMGFFLTERSSSELIERNDAHKFFDTNGCLRNRREVRISSRGKWDRRATHVSLFSHLAAQRQIRTHTPRLALTQLHGRKCQCGRARSILISSKRPIGSTVGSR